MGPDQVRGDNRDKRRPGSDPGLHWLIVVVSDRNFESLLSVLASKNHPAIGERDACSINIGWLFRRLFDLLGHSRLLEEVD